MSDDCAAALKSSMMTAFEEMAFTFVDWEHRSDEESLLLIGAGLTCSSSGAGQWRIVLAVSPNLLPGIAANMLGVSGEDLTNEDHLDALKELANVVCGNFLPAVAGAAAVWKVGAPLIVDALPSDRSSETIFAKLNLEGGRAEVWAQRVQ